MANVVSDFQDRLCKMLHPDDIALSSLAVGFKAKKIIGPQALATVQGKRGMDGAIFLLTRVCHKIDETKSGCLKTVFQVLKEQEYLSVIVEEMKEGLYELANCNFM